MEVRTAVADIVRLDAGAIMVGIYEGQERPDGEAARVDEAMGGAISQLISAGDIKGKLNHITVLHTLGKLPAPRVAVVGLGKKTDLTTEKLRSAVGQACRGLRGRGARTIAAEALGAGTAGLILAKAVQAMVEGCMLGLYVFRKHLTGEPENTEIEQFTIVDGESANRVDLEEGLRVGRVMARATIMARDLANEPANYMTPTDMANVAGGISRDFGLEISVLEREQVRDLGMGAFLGVAQGSQQPPKFIVLRYNGRKSTENDVALVGKGITFDSGGISIKPSEGMGDMKGDMAGGAAVMAAISAIAELKANINVVAVVAATENLPGGTALKPGDVLKSMSGKTIEIISTDAEGRLTLADAITYVRKLGARTIVDVATLTGGIQVALGNLCTGVFGNDAGLVDKIVSAGEEAGEHSWQLPMLEEYKDLNKSDVADIKNSGGRFGSSITAALFLAEFAGDTPWVHLDIAGTADTDKERGYLVKGATGIPVRTLVNLVMMLS